MVVYYFKVAMEMKASYLLVFQAFFIYVWSAEGHILL